MAHPFLEKRVKLLSSSGIMIQKRRILENRRRQPEDDMCHMPNDWLGLGLACGL
jgi:hypothetical protein